MNKHFRVSGSLFAKLEELGVSASAVLRRAGLPQELIDQPRVLLTTEELFALWRAVGEVSTNPATGLLLGTESKTERFHPIALAALSSENFGSAVQRSTFVTSLPSGVRLNRFEQAPNALPLLKRGSGFATGQGRAQGAKEDKNKKKGQGAAAQQRTRSRPVEGLGHYSPQFVSAEQTVLYSFFRRSLMTQVSAREGRST